MRVVTLARKPLAGRMGVAEGVLRHGCGSINVEACRIAADLEELEGRSGTASSGNQVYSPGIRNPHGGIWTPATGGRWPANLILGSQEANASRFFLVLGL